MKAKENIFFDDKITTLQEWEIEFTQKKADPDFHDKTKAMDRFIRDCGLLRRDMKREHDPGLTDSVDLDSRYFVLENTRRRLINDVQTEEAPF